MMPNNLPNSVAGSSTNVEATNTFMLALCILREARGEPREAQEAVACVIMNRVKRPGWWGKDLFEVITKPYQFSSFNKGEPNSVVFGNPLDPVWQQCYTIASLALAGQLVDATDGANYYYSKDLDVPPHFPPVWSVKYIHTCDIGAFHFFRDK